MPDQGNYYDRERERDRERDEQTERGRFVDRDMRLIRDVVSQIAGSVETRIHATDAVGQELKAKIDALDKLLRGDTTEGLVARVLSLNEKAALNAAEIKEIKAANAKFMWFFVGLLVTTIGTLITTLLQMVMSGKMH
jgi:uncharacterized protein YukE